MSQRGGLEVNAQQQAVVDHVLDNGVTVVSAGAGTGKTYTTVATVLELILQKRASAEQFVLITFTNKAANELRSRVREQLTKCRQSAKPTERAFWRGQLERLGVAYVGTIHGFCSQLLRRYGYEQAVARQADVSFSTRLRRDALADALEAYDQSPRLYGEPGQLRPHEITNLAKEIYDAMRNVGLDPSDVLGRTLLQEPDGGKATRVGMARLVADFHERYRKAKAEVHAVDAHDLLETTARMLADEPLVAARVGSQVRYLFVDEFQDTDHIQKRLVDSLIPHTEGVLVVGDNKQSIYAFRGADVLLLKQIADENGVHVLPISISRRPTRPLLEAQNALLTSMGRSSPSLDAPLAPYPEAFVPKSGPTAFKLLSHGKRPTPAERVAFIVKMVAGMLERPVDFGPKDTRPICLDDIVVLARTNRKVQLYAQGLMDRGIMARADQGTRFYEAPEIVGIYRLLRLVLHYPHDGVVSQALDTPYLAGLDAQAAERTLIQYRPAEGYLLVDWLEEHHKELASRLAKLRERMRTDTVSQLLGRLYVDLGVTEHHEQADDGPALLNLERLRDIARNLTSNEQALSLRQFVDFLRVAIQNGYEEDFATPPSRNKTHPYVRVMTIHRAKGLEFSFVIIPDARDPVVRRTKPSFLLHEHHGLDVQASPDLVTTTTRFNEELDLGRDLERQEAMRLLYVAVTRATHAVVLVGHGGLKIGRPGCWWSWQDEVLTARPELEKAGARFWHSNRDF